MGHVEAPMEALSAEIGRMEIAVLCMVSVATLQRKEAPFSPL